MSFYALKPLGFLSPLVQIAIIAGLFVWTTLWQYGEYKKTGKMFWAYPLSVSILFAPIYEEIIFRGFIFSTLLGMYSVVTAIIISSLLFGLWHIKNIFYLSSKKLSHQIAYTTIFVGPIAAIITLATGSIWIAVILHYLNNLTAHYFNKRLKQN